MTAIFKNKEYANRLTTKRLLNNTKWRTKKTIMKLSKTNLDMLDSSSNNGGHYSTS